MMAVTKTKIQASDFRPSDVERLWGQIDRRGPDECWPWTGTTCYGYGRFLVGTREVKAHAAVYALTKGVVPAGFLVRHSCDNPPCCNDAHLLLGDDADNKKDCIERGRLNPACGDQNGSRKYPERLSRGEAHYSREHPEKVPRGKNHWHARSPEKTLRGEDHPRAKLTSEQVVQIRERRASGETLKHIAKAFGVSRATAGRICSGQTWKSVK